MKTPQKLSLLASAILLSSCASLDNAGKDYGTAIGCVGGALLGAGLTYALTGNAEKAAYGGLAGGAVGCAAGHIWQNRLQQLEQIAQEEHLKMQLETLKTQAPASNGQPAAPSDAGLVAQVQDQGMFPVGSDQLSADGLRQVRKLAEAFKPAPGQKTQDGAILVVGHTDASGPADFNQQLSERRARSVGKVLAEAGIDPKSLYFQGVGAARPLADNATSEGRAQNRRVELVQVSSVALLQQRIKQEQNNPRYLAHGTRAPATETPRTTEVASSKSASVPSTPVAAPKAQTSKLSADFIDFGGIPANQDSWALGQLITPKSGGFSLISSAYASVPVSSCQADQPRVAGSVKNLASGDELAEAHDTDEYLPGLNGRVWANTLNGNLVAITPIAVLRDDAQVAKQPRIQLVKGYAQNHKGKATTLKAVANTFEGQDTLLYRVFIDDQQAPVSCLDVVLQKFSGKAVDGKLFYDRAGEAYVAKFVPIRT